MGKHWGYGKTLRLDLTRLGSTTYLQTLLPEYTYEKWRYNIPTHYPHMPRPISFELNKIDKELRGPGQTS